MKDFRSVNIIQEEGQAVDRSSMNILPTSNGYAEVIFVSENGEKLKLRNNKTVISSESSIDDFITNSSNYIFRPQDFIAISNNDGDEDADIPNTYSIHQFIGIDKESRSSYILFASGSGGSDGINGIQEGTNIQIDFSNPRNPIISTDVKNNYELWLAQGNIGTVIDYLNDISVYNAMILSIVDGELIVDNYLGDSAELVDGELILN